MASNSTSSTLTTIPSLTIPSRQSLDSAILSGFGMSPGPMTLVSSLFDPNSDHTSFSQLLAGTMCSPPEECPGLRFKQNRPDGIVISHSPFFTIPPGLSPACLLDSPAFFPDVQSPFGMSHQQALAQVTAQAAQAHYMQMQAEYASSLSINPTATTHNQMISVRSDSEATIIESQEISQPDKKVQSTQLTVDKPADDGYNWRKYGQKHVKGSEYPRSYYKCTHPGCPVKKKVEHSTDGQVAEINYKSQHNHPPPQPKRSKDNPNGNLNHQTSIELISKVQTGNSNTLKEDVPSSLIVSEVDHDSNQATPERGSSGSEGVTDKETKDDQREEDEPDCKRRSMEGRSSEIAPLHRTVTEHKIIVQTTSEVDLLDDGYRWRKYGQKVVKGNLYPRSYYKCTYPECNVRKHVERAATDPKAVVTAYEGKHNHDVPIGKSNARYSNVSQLKSHSVAPTKQVFANRNREIENYDEPVAVLQLKEHATT